MDHVFAFLIALLGALPPVIVATAALLVAIRNARNTAVQAVEAAEGARVEATSAKRAAVVAIAENTQITKGVAAAVEVVQEQTNGHREEQARIMADALAKIAVLIDKVGALEAAALKEAP